jgi:hypothetical protein
MPSDVFAVEKRLLLAVLVVAAFLLLRRLFRREDHPVWRAAPWLAAGAGLVAVAVYAVMIVEHLRFPLQLECMELTVLQHAERLAAGLPIYAAPTADFVPLAYNPGYYFVLYPFITLFGANLHVARMPAVLAAVGLCVVFFDQARRATGDWRWALFLTALPIAASRSFDLYLTKGHGDSLLVLALVGAALLLEQRERPLDVRRAVIAAILVGCAFWFKQHAALVAIGVVLLLFLRDGWRAWPAIGVIFVIGPVLYLFVAPRLLGPDFFESTYIVPSSWSHWQIGGVARFLGYLAGWWLVPTVVAVAAWVHALRRRRLIDDPVLFLLPFALATGLMGSLDWGSSDNVYLLAGVWLLLVTVRTLGPRLTAPGRSWREYAALAAVLATFAQMASDPRDWFPDRGYGRAYRDFVSYVENLDGPIFAPGLGDLPFAKETTSRAHWVALEDRVRGSGYEDQVFPFVKSVLAPVWKTPAPAYLVSVRPLEKDSILFWLADYYELQEVVGDRFSALRELPCRYGRRVPAYIYRRKSESLTQSGGSDHGE